MYSPYNKRYSFIDSPRSFWLDLIVGYGCLIAALCVFWVAFIVLGVV